MRRFPCAVAFAAALLTVLPATAAGKGFTYGVTAGEVTSSSAILWTRSDKTGSVKLEVSAGNRIFGQRGDLSKNLTATAARDNTVQTKVSKLKVGTVYYYRFSKGSNRSDAGRFETAPASSKDGAVAFALSGDADATRASGMTTPFWGTMNVYRAMAKETNDFNVNLGDTIYSDSEVAAAQGQADPPPALTVAEKWAKYKLNLGTKNLQLVRRSTGLYSHWDDHEFINDFSKAENGQTVYDAGVQAFRDYSPVTYSKSRGIYRRMQWGKNLELFFLDERSFRDAKADDQCINPQSGSPDLAPMAPQRIRDVFAVLIPSLSQPTSQQCKDAINSPDRTFLGRSQMTRFKNEVKASKATFKIIVNEMPIQRLYALPYDRWEGYEAERQELLKHLQANVKNVLFLSTDIHGTFVNDASLAYFPEEGGPTETGIVDYTTGPVATRTFENQVDDTAGREGAGDAAEAGFFKPPPPNGLGMECSNADANSYLQVTATSKSVLIQPRDSAGKALTEQSGAACGPFTVKRK